METHPSELIRHGGKKKTAAQEAEMLRKELALSQAEIVDMGRNESEMKRRVEHLIREKDLVGQQLTEATQSTALTVLISVGMNLTAQTLRVRAIAVVTKPHCPCYLEREVVLQDTTRACSG